MNVEFSVDWRQLFLDTWTFLVLSNLSLSALLEPADTAETGYGNGNANDGNDDNDSNVRSRRSCVNATKSLGFCLWRSDTYLLELLF